MEIFDNNLGQIDEASVDDRLRISSVPNRSYDPVAFEQFLEAARWRNRVRYVEVALASNLANCQFMRFLPAAESLSLSGKRVQSIGGIELATKLWNLTVSGDKKNRIDLAALQASRVSSLRIENPRTEDIRSINQSKEINELHILNGEFQEFAQLDSLKLKSLGIAKSSLEEIDDLDKLAAVESLVIAGCRRLKSFTRDADNVANFRIESCPLFIADSIARLRKARRVWVLGCKSAFRFNALGALDELEELTIANTGVVVDDTTISGFSRLRKLWISPAKEATIQKVSEQCPKARVCNGSATYIGGVKQATMQAFYE